MYSLLVAVLFDRSQTLPTCMSSWFKCPQWNYAQVMDKNIFILLQPLPRQLPYVNEGKCKGSYWHPLWNFNWFKKSEQASNKVYYKSMVFMRLKAAMFVVIYNFFSLYNFIATTSLSFYSLVICSYKTLITQTTLFNWSDILLLKIVDSRDSEYVRKRTFG